MIRGIAVLLVDLSENTLTDGFTCDDSSQKTRNGSGKHMTVKRREREKKKASGGTGDVCDGGIIMKAMIRSRKAPVVHIVPGSLAKLSCGLMFRSFNRIWRGMLTILLCAQAKQNWCQTRKTHT